MLMHIAETTIVRMGIQYTGALMMHYRLAEADLLTPAKRIGSTVLLVPGSPLAMYLDFGSGLLDFAQVVAGEFDI
jgi:hypothetical protein